MPQTCNQKVKRKILKKYILVTDPRTNDWFLVGCPWTVIILMYLYVKLVTKWGPKWMENRPPFNLDRIVQVYDVFQVVANARIFYQVRP